MKTEILGLAAAVSLAAASVGFAQQPPGPPPGPRGEHMRPDPAQMAERHAQRLRDTLQLRPDQEPALRAFVEAARPPMGDHMRMRGDRGEAQTLTTPERLDRMRERLNVRVAAFDRRAAATKRFYAQLSPAQQKAFDAMPHGTGRGGHRGHRGPGHFGGPRG
jgi:protein CpxP